MTALTPREVQAVADLADVLYEFLPGTPHPRADRRLSFPGSATSAGVSEFWTGGSKRPAVAQLLRSTLEQRRGAFCKLIAAVVSNALIYRQKKNPLTRTEIERVNELVRLLDFKIPELWDETFLRSLATDEVRSPAGTPSASPTASTLAALRQDFLDLARLEPRQRGYAFERTLTELFHVFEMSPRGAFRLVGEQIDGSFDQNGATYLVEAKWTGPQVGFAELMTFAGKVQAKARWSRGLFVSYSGYTEDGLEAFARGRATDIVCMDGADLWYVLSDQIDLRNLIELKARRAVETGRAFIPARELFAHVT